MALFLDFDGTLVEIAETPDAILIPDDLMRRLEDLAARVDGRLALVTGRSLADIGAHLGPSSIMIVGSHGAEQDDAALPTAPLARDATASIATLAAQWPGLLIETKPHGIAIHYRQEPDAETAVFTVMDDIAEREGLAVRRGKMVVELGPAQANKGQAVARLMREPAYAGAMPVFIGDDVTDEDGFAAAAAAGGHGILVGAQRPTAARYRLADPREVYRWLDL
ncbi:trehalose-phosphatase [Sphingopyxis chilensis]|uniref:trehalose-phosphatase n=1 Tax=Sphingopyxis chilensis TaxID=180400 RepID=UPI002DDDB1EF|nr:trehalose-phosphatase [Sphingopyxis chilensis]